MFLRCNWQLKKKIDLVFHSSKCKHQKPYVFVRILPKNEFWSLKVGACSGYTDSVKIFLTDFG